MEDITINVGEHLFNFRVSAVFKNGNKILTHHSDDSSLYTLPGGRVKEGENTMAALKREIKEEMGIEAECVRPISFIENFFVLNGKKYHELLVTYEMKFKDEKAYKKDAIEAIEEEKKNKLHFIWMDKKELEKINFVPKKLLDVIQNDSKEFVHIINDDTDKILLASKNPAKIKLYGDELKRRGINLIGLSEISDKIMINENGKNALENAIIKSEECNKVTHLTTISIDDTLFFENVSEEDQPGTNVRRVHGKRLTDEESIEHYSNLAKKYGGKLKAKWVKAVAITKDNKTKTYEFSRESFYLIDKPSKIINEGYPLNSITIVPKYNKYLSELSEAENKEYSKESNYDKVFEFIMKNI